MAVDTTRSTPHHTFDTVRSAKRIDPSETLMPTMDGNESSHTWAFNKPHCLLINNEVVVNLTRSECVILDLLVSSKERVVSKETITRELKKDLDHYKGMHMCFSRLQAKFKKFSEGDDLFRAVRNRGYCLTQIIHLDKGSPHSSHPPSE